MECSCGVIFVERDSSDTICPMCLLNNKEEERKRKDNKRIENIEKRLIRLESLVEKF